MSRRMDPEKFKLLLECIRREKQEQKSSWVLVGVSEIAKKYRQPLKRTKSIGKIPGKGRILLKSKVLSREHCTLRIKNDKVFLTDHNSTNGTYVNHKCVKDARRELADGDIIGFGINTAKFDPDGPYFVYRLRRIECAEVIDLNDDENEVDDKMSLQKKLNLMAEKESEWAGTENASCASPQQTSNDGVFAKIEAIKKRNAERSAESAARPPMISPPMMPSLPEVPSSMASLPKASLPMALPPMVFQPMMSPPMASSPMASQPIHSPPFRGSGFQNNGYCQPNTSSRVYPSIPRHPIKPVLPPQPVPPPENWPTLVRDPRIRPRETQNVVPPTPQATVSVPQTDHAIELHPIARSFGMPCEVIETRMCPVDMDISYSPIDIASPQMQPLTETPLITPIADGLATLELTPPILLAINDEVQIDIKQEVHHLATDFDREATDAPEIIDTDVIDLTLTDSDEPPPAEEAPLRPIRKRRNTAYNWTTDLMKIEEPKPIAVKKKSATVRPARPIRPVFEPAKDVEFKESTKKARVKMTFNSRSDFLTKDFISGDCESEAGSSASAANETTPAGLVQASTTPKASSKSKRGIFDILKDITCWEKEWLSMPAGEVPPINGPNHVVRPRQLIFKTAAEYQSVIEPLLKLELWSALLNREQDEEPRNVKLITVNTNPGGFTYHCEASDKRVNVKRHDFVMVTCRSGHLFAYVSQLSLPDEKSQDNFSFTMETGKEPDPGPELVVRPILNIKWYLRQFIANLEMGSFKLLPQLLSPSRLAISIPNADNREDAAMKSLKDEQVAVVNSVFQRCVQSLTGSQPSIELIEGGAGTGKSTIVSMLVQKLLANSSTNNKHILICTVDDKTATSIALKLLQQRSDSGMAPGLVRLGRSDKVPSQLRPYCVTSLFREKKRILKAAVVCATLNDAADLKRLNDIKIDVAIIDEATLCTEAAILPVLKYGVMSLVLLGDATLAPFTRSTATGHSMRSMFARIRDVFGDNGVHHLKTQCRMHAEILKWPNECLYNNSMVAGNSTVSNPLPLMPYTVFSVETEAFNGMEFITDFLRAMTDVVCPKTSTYGVITPLPQQQHDLKKKFSENPTLLDIDVDSFESFCGIEKDIIVIHALNKREDFTYFAEPGKLNVALTRARKCLIVFGNFEMVKSIMTCNSFLPDAQKRKRLFVIDAFSNPSECLNHVKL